jgi:hypothetical protein
MLKSLWQGVKKLWEAWKVLARKIGTFQARVLLTVIYAVLVLPFGLCVRLFADSLRTKKLPSRWLDRSPEAFDMEWAQRQ